jgi:hypothetical protein
VRAFFPESPVLTKKPCNLIGLGSPGKYRIPKRLSENSTTHIFKNEEGQ